MKSSCRLVARLTPTKLRQREHRCNGFSLPAALLLCSALAAHGDTTLMESWMAGATLNAITTFVAQANSPGDAGFIRPQARIAVFDLDGTLLGEKPDYVGGLISETRLRERAADDAALADRPLYKAALEHDRTYLHKHYKQVHLESFAGQTLASYRSYVQAFMKNQTHPRFQRPYRDLVFQPMRELIRYLQDHGFAVYVVSTSPQEFIRSFSDELLGIPEEHVIGSVVSFQRDEPARPRSFHRQTRWLEPFNGGEGKVLRIRERTGRLPVLTCGNGVGDRAMLEATDATVGPHLVMVLDHDDAEREYEYHKALLLKIAESRGWPVISMRRDFKRVFAPPETSD